MPELRLESRVYYMAGPWGANVPVPNVSISIIDVDAPGQGDDTIWSGTTSSDGRVSGVSREWRDRISEDILVPDGWFSAHWETVSSPDYADMLALTAHVRDGEHEVWLPFVYVGESQPSPPLVLPWGPPNATSFVPLFPAVTFDPSPAFAYLASVNDHGCATPAAIGSRVRAEIAARASALTIEVFEPLSVQLLRRTGAVGGVHAWAGEWLEIPERWRPSVNRWLDADVSGMSVGCAVVTAAAGASPLLVEIGVSLLHAVDRGYRDITMSELGKTRRLPGTGVRLIARLAR